MQEFSKPGSGRESEPRASERSTAEVRLDSAEYELRQLVSQLETVLRDAGIERKASREDAETSAADQFDAFAAATRTGSAR